MTIYKPGDIILIPFPFTDLTAIKQRPSIVLSSSQFNRKHEDVIVAAITSHLPKKLSDDEYLLDVREQTSAHLPKASIVKLTKIATIDQSLIRKRIGYVSLNARKHIIIALFKIFQES